MCEVKDALKDLFEQHVSPVYKLFCSPVQKRNLG